MVRKRWLLSVLPALVAMAAGGAPLGGLDRAPAEPQAAVASGASPAEKLLNTYAAFGNGNGAVLSQNAYLTLTTSNVACANASGCAIEIDSTVQIQPNNGEWAICLLVDGAAVSCERQGNQAALSSYIVGNARACAAHVGKGMHAVTMQIFSASATARYGYFQAETRVYRP